MGATAANTLYPPFKIIVKNKQLKTNIEVSTTKYVEVHIYDYVIKIDQNKVITVTYPLTSSVTDVNYDVTLSNGVSVYIAGIIMTDFGLTVTFDGKYNLYVNIPDDMVGMTEGLCGDNNMDASNDLTKRNGVLTTKVNAFANSWFEYDPSSPT